MNLFAVQELLSHSWTGTTARCRYAAHDHFLTSGMAVLLQPSLLATAPAAYQRAIDDLAHRSGIAA
ncbi:hypothetical protein ACTMTI_51015 [Nonomuraea sp. H19]|uniref:hypothetical protein n=1 Tax=Nonomuraea sp. H19 TaxID=3452206 RepID=UPI003F8A1C13